MTKSMGKRYFAVFAVMLITASLIMTAFSMSNGLKAADPVSTEGKRTMSVLGQGTVKVVPDIAYITLGVVTENENAKNAQQDNAKAMDMVVAAIKNLGVKSEDIKTVGYCIYPKTSYNNNTGESKIIGYFVNNTVQVTVKNLDKLGNIIDAAAANGANVTGNISFGLSDYEKCYNEALKAAVTSAKNRAETMAGALGFKLKLPVSINESGGSYYPPVYAGGAYDSKSESAYQTPVEAGSMEVKASVSMVYEY